MRLKAFTHEKRETSPMLCHSPKGGLNDDDEESDLELGSFPVLVIEK